MAGDTLLLHSASMISSTRRTDTPCQVHLDERFFYAAFLPPVPLYDGYLKCDSFQFRYVQRYIAGCDGQILAVMPAPVSLPLFIPLVPRCLGQFHPPLLPAVHSAFLLRSRAPIP